MLPGTSVFTNTDQSREFRDVDLLPSSSSALNECSTAWAEKEKAPVSKTTGASLKEEWTVADITLCPIIFRMNRCLRIHPWSSIL